MTTATIMLRALKKIAKDVRFSRDRRTLGSSNGFGFGTPGDCVFCGSGVLAPMHQPSCPTRIAGDALKKLEHVRRTREKQ